MKLLTQYYITTLLILILAPDLRAGEAESIDITQLKLGDQAQLVSENGETLIRVKSTTDDKPKDILFFKLDELDIKENAYSLTGEVRYENVAGRSYLETWNHFVSDQSGKSEPVKFFTRGLTHTGPMAVLSANSDWREFQLPFFVNPDGVKLEGPTKITFNLHLEGRGLVEIRNVKLVDGFEGMNSFHVSHDLGRPILWVLFSLLAFLIVPAIVITIIIVSLRRKKRTAEELRRIRAADV